MFFQRIHHWEVLVSFGVHRLMQKVGCNQRIYRRPAIYIANGHISATRLPIHFVFGSKWGFRDGGSNGAISANYMYG